MKIKVGTAYLMEDGEFLICETIYTDFILWSRSDGDTQFCTTAPYKKIEAVEFLVVNR